MKELRKENVENLSYKDIADLILENNQKGMNTLELLTHIIEILELPKSMIDKKIGDFYTSMTTDKRFVLVDGLWDLRSRHTSDKVLVKAIDEEDEDIDAVEIDENSMEEEDEDSFDTDNSLDEDNFDDEEDDLSDLVVLDEEDLDLENN